MELAISDHSVGREAVRFLAEVEMIILAGVATSEMRHLQQRERAAMLYDVINPSSFQKARRVGEKCGHPLVSAFRYR